MTTAFQSAPFILNPQQAKQTAPMCGSIKAQRSEDHTVTHRPVASLEYQGDEEFSERGQI